MPPTPPPQLAAALNRFAAQLDDRDGHAAFVRIHMTSSERATGDVAERHRRRALKLAERFGMPVHPPGTRPGFNWDGAALDADTEAYVILHEIAHFVLAPPERRRLVDFGLGPGAGHPQAGAAHRGPR